MDKELKKSNSKFKPVKKVKIQSIISINKFDELLSKDFLESYFKKK